VAAEAKNKMSTLTSCARRLRSFPERHHKACGFVTTRCGVLHGVGHPKMECAIVEVSHGHVP